ncbi:MAG TPA: TerC family protein, partial [Tianweitania sediminis]|nr:TerC family protein [Tianweitania sediminis]
MLEVFAQPEFWASVVLLIGMEVALSADNFVFISTLAAKLPEEQRKRVLGIGMVLAAIFRLALLLGVVWIMGLQRTAFALGGWAPSWRELILLAGGLFLIYKAVTELHALVEPHPHPRSSGEATAVSESAVMAILQIALINAVFSVDSIITAIGLTPYVEAMAIAIIVSIAILFFAAQWFGAFVARHPSVKALALGFLLMVGIILVADGLGFQVLRPYLYGAMVFAILVLLAAKLIRHFAAGTVHPVGHVQQSHGMGDRHEPTIDPLPAASADAVATGEPVLEAAAGTAPEPVLEDPSEPQFAFDHADPSTPVETIEPAEPEGDEEGVDPV